jgi:hypothetical protein
MNKVLTIFLAVAAVALFAAVSYGAYGYLRISAPLAASSVTVKPVGIGVAKVVGVEAMNVVSNKTIILSAISPDNVSTNVKVTLTTTVTTGQNQFFDLSSAGYFWLVEGESVRRAGTETNAVVRLIYEN